MAERSAARAAKTCLTAIVVGDQAAGAHRRGDHTRLPRSRFSRLPGRSLPRGAVAAGRLLRLDPTQMGQAIALSATSIGGLMAAANTSTAREYHAGLAAMLGVEAALAAQRGYRGGREHSLYFGSDFFKSMAGPRVPRPSLA